MIEMSEEKTRVDFNAPVSLVEQADHVADLLDVSRTQILIDALREEINDLASDDGFQRRLRDAYYSDEVEFEIVQSILGTEEAMRMKLLRDSIDQEPPEPRLEGDLLDDDEFYEGDARPEWTSDDADGDAVHRE